MASSGIEGAEAGAPVETEVFSRAAMVSSRPLAACLSSSGLDLKKGDNKYVRGKKKQNRTKQPKQRDCRRLQRTCSLILSSKKETRPIRNFLNYKRSKTSLLFKLPDDLLQLALKLADGCHLCRRKRWLGVEFVSSIPPIKSHIIREWQNVQLFILKWDQQKSS